MDQGIQSGYFDSDLLLRQFLRDELEGSVVLVVVVFDRQYTPTLLDNDKHRYVPAEAVYAVFECKPSN